MAPTLGNLALILTLCVAVMQATIPLVGSWRGRETWMRLAHPLAVAQSSFLFFSFFCLVYAFITNDFSVMYVAENSNSALPLLYRICAVWGSHEGSMLLWVVILGGWTVAVAYRSSALPLVMRTRILSVLAMVSIGFLLFLIMTSNPFVRFPAEIPIPFDGRDLNPLLQDIGFVMHPPLLYMGYVGFSVVFAFAIAALMRGGLEPKWIRWSRTWTLSAWCFLTAGVMLGSWWAYRELGWGGWWFWDPVENASFLPWLVGTALIHSLIVTEKRHIFQLWTLLLAIVVFSLSLLGTFLVRSGVLISVHAFASDPTRGVFMLLFLGIVVGGSLLLYAWRAPLLKNRGSFEFLSRETWILGGNILLFVMMASVLLGTLYPLVIDALGSGKLSVGAPYFNTVMLPLFCLLLVLMGIGPACHWQRTSFSLLRHRLVIPFILSVLLAIALPWLVMGEVRFGVALGLMLAFWVITTVLYRAVLRRRFKGLFVMGLAHMGIAVTAIGIVLTSSYSVEREVKMSLNDSVVVGPYEFQFLNIDARRGPNYASIVGHFHATKKDDGDRVIKITVEKEVKEVKGMKELRELKEVQEVQEVQEVKEAGEGKEDKEKDRVIEIDPEKRFYGARQMIMTDAGVASNLWRDLYVALGEPIGDGSWSVRLYYKPFIRWIWLGGILMVLGGGIGAFRRKL